MIKRIIATILTMLVPVLGVWLAGYDFDSRGQMAFMLFLFVIFAFVFQWFAPWWDGSKK